MLSVVRKDVLPIGQKIICEYSCYCDSKCVGRTLQRLQDRIKQHVCKWLQQQEKRPTRFQLGRSCKQKCVNPDCDSAIGRHLLENEHSTANCDDKRFKILAEAPDLFYFCLLQALFIKTRHPVLYGQNKFFYTFKLVVM